MARESLAVGEAVERAEEAQAAGLVGYNQVFQEQATEQPREHAHRQEETRPAGHPMAAIG